MAHTESSAKPAIGYSTLQDARDQLAQMQDRGTNAFHHANGTKRTKFAIAQEKC